MKKKILVYLPPKQMLPNNPLFTKSTLEKCNKLMLFRKGLTLILSDDINLKINLATALASNYGKKVLLEKLPEFGDDIICSSYEWWIDNINLINTPEKIIVPLLPLPNMSDPVNQINVSHNKKLSKNWFREYLLPEVIEKLEKAVSPLRKNAGKLVILDGRANKKQWARTVLQTIQPSQKINYIFPFD